MSELTTFDGICPVCKAAGVKSRVYTDGGTITTAMAFSPGYYDEDGVWIRGRNPNWRTTAYDCSRGHHFAVSRREGDPDQISVRPPLDSGGGPA